MKGDAKRGATIAFGSYGLKALDQHWLTDRQIEAARQALTRHMKREGNVWIRLWLSLRTERLNGQAPTR